MLVEANENPSQVPSSAKDGPERPQLLSSGTNLEYSIPVEQPLILQREESNDGEDSATPWHTTANLEQQQPGLAQPSVSFEILDQYNSDLYQQRVTSMISDLSSAVLCNSYVAEIPLLKLPRGGHNNKSSTVSHGSSGGFRGPDESSPVRYTSGHHAAIPSPSNFSISSVDDLQCLGIKPTIQSAQLLQACKQM